MNEDIPPQAEIVPTPPESVHERPVVSYEDAERAESHREIAYHLPEAMAEDLGHPTTRKGWTSYWRTRLASTLKPEEIERLIKVDRFQKYVNQEVTEAQYTERRTAVMQRLAAQLAETDQRIEYPEEELMGRREVLFDAELGSYYIENKKGEHVPFHFHDIGPDLEWGVAYRPSPSVPKDAWRSVRKRSAIAEARMDIEGIDNEELAESECLSLPTTTLSGKWIEQSFRLGKNPGLHGVISERMAKNALLRLSKEQPDLGIRVENANAIEDAELKYDFKVQFDESHRRGIATEPEGFSREDYVAEKRMLGIQFTAGSIQGKTAKIVEARKHLDDEQMQRHVKHKVEDIVLVQLNLSAQERYQHWLNEEKPPGGPERYIDKYEIDYLIECIRNGQETQFIYKSAQKTIKPSVNQGPTSKEQGRKIKVPGGNISLG